MYESNDQKKNQHNDFVRLLSQCMYQPYYFKTYKVR